jgi:prepilin-type N-terminal cleavage/methylation domain-containing protein
VRPTLRDRRGSDDGVTLVEVLVTIVLLSAISAAVLSATLVTQKLMRTTDNETRGQEDVAVVTDRLSRDLREARGVVCDGAASDPSCSGHLQLWIDTNSDYRQSSDEIITWHLQANAGDPGHYNMVRTVNGTSMVEARTIVQNVAFNYDVAPGPSQPRPGDITTRQVTMTMYYDAVVNNAPSTRTLTFSTLRRNVP